eukprot:116510-Hanusia_phi.AAC.3
MLGSFFNVTQASSTQCFPQAMMLSSVISLRPGLSSSNIIPQSHSLSCSLPTRISRHLYSSLYVSILPPLPESLFSAAICFCPCSSCPIYSSCDSLLL